MATLARQGGLAAQMRPTGANATQHKALLFFREVARCLPYVLKTYKLEELTTVSELRRNVAKLFRQYEDVKRSEAIDLLVYKGREELEMVMMQHKQRHHLIDKYIKNPALEKVEKPRQYSAFLEKFLVSN